MNDSPLCEEDPAHGQMDLVSMSPDGQGCDWLCWACYYEECKCYGADGVTEPRCPSCIDEIYKNYPHNLRSHR